MHGGDRRLNRVGAEPLRGQCLPHAAQAFRNLLAIPERSILIVEEDDIAVARRACGAPRIVQQHQREKPHRLRLGQQIDEQAAEADRLAGQIATRHGGSRRRGVALVEHQIDDAQHRVEALGQFLPRRHLIGNLRVANLRFRAHDPLRERRSRCEEGVRDLFGAQPADFAQGQCDLRVGGQRGMAAGENQTKAIVWDFTCIDGDVGRRAGLVQRIEPLLPPQAVDRLEPAGRHEPRSGVRRNAVARPLFERRPEGVVQRLLGGIEIAEQPDERRENAPGFGNVDGIHRLQD